MKQHLDSDGFFELNDLGTLRCNDEGHYEFEPCEAGILTPSLYGLSSFEMEVIGEAHAVAAPAVKQEQAEVREKKAALQPVKKDSPAEAQAEEDSAEAAETEADDNKESDTLVIPMAWVRNAVAIAAAIVAFFFLTTPVSNSLMENGIQQGTIMPTITKQVAKTAQAAKPAKAEEAEKTVSAEQKAQDKQAENAAQAEPTNKEELAEPKAEAPAETASDTYCIVLASQTTQHLAEDYVARLHREGFNEARMYINNNMVRVVFGSFNSESEAHNRLQQLRDNAHFEEAWVYKMAH